MTKLEKFLNDIKPNIRFSTKDVSIALGVASGTLAQRLNTFVDNGFMANSGKIGRCSAYVKSKDQCDHLSKMLNCGNKRRKLADRSNDIRWGEAIKGNAGSTINLVGRLKMK